MTLTLVATTPAAELATTPTTGRLPRLGRELATARTAEARAQLDAGLANVADLVAREAWADMGYPSVTAWVEGEFGNLADRRLDRATFRALAAAYVAEGKSTRAAGQALGKSASAVSAATREVARPEKVLGLDNRERRVGHLQVPRQQAEVVEAEVVADTWAPATAVAATVLRPDGGPKARVLAAARAAGAEGMTYLELCKQLGLRANQVSPALTKLDRAGQLQRTATYRGGCAAYVSVVPALG